MHFPAAIVTYADALLDPQPAPEATTAFRTYLQDTVSWLETACDFPLSETDARGITATRQLLEEVARAAEARILKPRERSRRLVELAASLAAHLERLRLARDRTYLVAIPDVDRLLVAGIAVLQGRAGRDALAPRREPARRALARLASELERLAPDPELDLDGLRAASRQASEAAEQLDQDLKSGLKRLMDAARRLESLHAACQKRDTTSLGIAELDGALGTLLRAAAVAPPEAWESALQEFDVDEAEGSWQGWFERALLNASARHHGPALFGEVLSELRAAAQEADRSRVTSAIRALEALQRRLQRSCLRLDQAFGTILEAPAQALAAAYQGEVPRLVLQEVAEAFADPAAPPGTARVRERVAGYLASGDRSLLLDGLEMLLEAVEEMARPGYALRGLVCRCCGQPYTLHAEHDWCGQPGRSHRFLDVCA